MLELKDIRRIEWLLKNANSKIMDALAIAKDITPPPELIPEDPPTPSVDLRRYPLVHDGVGLQKPGRLARNRRHYWGRS
jgi:hypothetical protein